MIVKQIWTGNAYRNFNYLVVCPETGEALAIDPLDHKKCLAQAKDNGWDITQIVNTHEHDDHIGGNRSVQDATQAKLLAHRNAGRTIPDIDRGLDAGDVITVGKTVELLALDTPGHTMSHVCLLFYGDTPAIFSGDTLFNAGAGNCHGGGHPEELFNTFENQLSKLSPRTLIYPGHDYLTNNLAFTLDREANNSVASDLLNKLSNDHDPENPLVTSLSLEMKINTFFRLSNETVISTLRNNFPELDQNPSEREVFLKLRELRNDW